MLAVWTVVAIECAYIAYLIVRVVCRERRQQRVSNASSNEWFRPEVVEKRSVIQIADELLDQHHRLELESFDRELRNSRLKGR